MGTEKSATDSISVRTSSVISSASSGTPNIEEEFVVDWRVMADLSLRRMISASMRNHGELDEVGGGALQWRVDGGALGAKPRWFGLAAGVDVGGWSEVMRPKAVRTDCARRT